MYKILHLTTSSFVKDYINFDLDLETDTYDEAMEVINGILLAKYIVIDDSGTVLSLRSREECSASFFEPVSIKSVIN